MPIARPAAAIDPCLAISSRSRILPGPIEPQPLNSTRSESRAMALACRQHGRRRIDPGARHYLAAEVAQRQLEMLDIQKNVLGADVTHGAEADHAPVEPRRTGADDHRAIALAHMA